MSEKDSLGLVNMSGEHSKEADVVVITAREIYDRVVATEGKVDRLLDSLDPLARRVDAVEARVGKIEGAIVELKIGAARSDWLPRLALGLLGAVIGGVMLWLITSGA